MAALRMLKARVSPETKDRVQRAAAKALLTESIWLRRAIDAALARESDAVAEPVAAPATGSYLDGRSADRGPIDRRTRLDIRLRREDQRLLRERAAARGMPRTTYVSVLVRAHLRQLAPLPKAELEALKRSVTELGAIGRNLNQIARSVNQGRPGTATREDLKALLRVCEVLRGETKSLLKANHESWATGEANHER